MRTPMVPSIRRARRRARDGAYIGNSSRWSSAAASSAQRVFKRSPRRALLDRRTRSSAVLQGDKLDRLRELPRCVTRTPAPSVASSPDHKQTTASRVERACSPMPGRRAVASLDGSEREPLGRRHARGSSRAGASWASYETTASRRCRSAPARMLVGASDEGSHGLQRSLALPSGE
jgi:hypothetical protein